MFRWCVVELLLLLLNKNAVSGLEEGDHCILNATGSQGLCTSLPNCKHALDDFVTNQKFPETCGYQGMDPIVCCTQSSAPIPTVSSPSNTQTSKPPPYESRRVGDISRQKCKEYGKYAEKPCGYDKDRLLISYEGVIRKEFPHMARIGYESTSNNETQWQCTGSVISPQFILTVAHCTDSPVIGPAKYVRVGVTDLNSNDHMQMFNVAERITHPDYNRPSFYHDIALLKLEKPIDLNDFARPACLYTDRNIHAQNAIESGWGRTGYFGDEISNKLLKRTLDFAAIDICNASYNINRKIKNGIVDDLQICAGFEEKDFLCQGNSGGPLQLYHDQNDVKCMYDIVGIASFGKACGIGKIPQVYTRVSNYIKWIEDIVWP